MTFSPQRGAESLSSSLNKYLPVHVILLSDCIYYDASVDPLVSSIRSIMLSSLTCTEPSQTSSKVVLYCSFELRPDKIMYIKKFLLALTGKEDYPHVHHSLDRPSTTASTASLSSNLRSPLHISCEFIPSSAMDPIFQTPDIILLKAVGTLQGWLQDAM